MGDTSVTVAVKHYTFPNASVKAKAIIDWLINRDIIKSVPSDCVLGSEDGYAVSDGAKMIVDFPKDLPFDLITNGLQVNVGREVLASFPEEIICPECKENITDEEWNVGDWVDGKSDNMLCPKCKTESEISTYKFVPEWTFTNLSFTFWNWPEFNSEFIREFEKQLECQIVISYGKI